MPFHPAMFSRLARSASHLPLHTTVRYFATQRTINIASSVSATSLTRSIQTTAHVQGQAAIAVQQNKDEPEPEPEHISTTHTQLYHHGNKFERESYWKKIPRWRNATETDWLSHKWQVKENVRGMGQFRKFLDETLPTELLASGNHNPNVTREQYIDDVQQGAEKSTMAIRYTPHILSLIDWKNPIEDPLARQFIPLKSKMIADHPKLMLDSLHEAHDSPVDGLVHRYPDKVLFLATNVCGLYCRFCTRSYGVGADTDTVTKASLVKSSPKRWPKIFEYIASTPEINDVVISGGDAYFLQDHELLTLGRRVLETPNIRRFRIATKGLCVSPHRTLSPDDRWTDVLIELSNLGRQMGKEVALHTHFNHPQEITWVTREASQRLFQHGVIVRNQTVLIRGVNDNVETMGALIRELTDNNIKPYYVYQHDLVSGVDDLRTPLSTILDIEQKLRGSIAGWAMPQFVVDLPGGGGKRLAASYESYDTYTGISKFTAPAIKGGTKLYEYYDPLEFTKVDASYFQEAAGLPLPDVINQSPRFEELQSPVDDKISAARGAFSAKGSQNPEEAGEDSPAKKARLRRRQFVEQLNAKQTSGDSAWGQFF